MSRVPAVEILTDQPISQPTPEQSDPTTERSGIILPGQISPAPSDPALLPSARFEQWVVPSDLEMLQLAIDHFDFNTASELLSRVVLPEDDCDARGRSRHTKMIQLIMRHVGAYLPNGDNSTEIPLSLMRPLFPLFKRLKGIQPLHPLMLSTVADLMGIARFELAVYQFVRSLLKMSPPHIAEAFEFLRDLPPIFISGGTIGLYERKVSRQLQRAIARSAWPEVQSLVLATADEDLFSSLRWTREILPRLKESVRGIIDRRNEPELAVFLGLFPFLATEATSYCQLLRRTSLKDLLTRAREGEVGFSAFCDAIGEGREWAATDAMEDEEGVEVPIFSWVMMLGNERMLAHVVRAGADVNAVSASGLTPTQYGERENRLANVEWLHNYQRTQLLDTRAMIGSQVVTQESATPPFGPDDAGRAGEEGVVLSAPVAERPEEGVTWLLQGAEELVARPTAAVGAPPSSPGPREAWASCAGPTRPSEISDPSPDGVAARTHTEESAVHLRRPPPSPSLQRGSSARALLLAPVQQASETRGAVTMDAVYSLVADVSQSTGALVAMVLRENAEGLMIEEREGSENGSRRERTPAETALVPAAPALALLGAGGASVPSPAIETTPRAAEEGRVQTEVSHDTDLLEQEGVIHFGP